METGGLTNQRREKRSSKKSLNCPQRPSDCQGIAHTELGAHCIAWNPGEGEDASR